MFFDVLFDMMNDTLMKWHSRRDKKVKQAYYFKALIFYAIW